MWPGEGCTHQNCTTEQQLDTWSCHNQPLLKITQHKDVPSSPVILYWQWNLLQMFKWLLVSGFTISWYKNLKNYKTKYQNCRGLSCVTILPKVQHPAELLHLLLEHSKLRLLSETFAKSSTKVWGCQTSFTQKHFSSALWTSVAPLAGLELSCTVTEEENLEQMHNR